MPKRVRWHLRTTPEVISGLLGVFLRAVETTIRQNSPDAPRGARFGAVAFVHRFGSYLNSHVHFHVLVTDGVFSAGDDDTAVFHPAVHLDQADYLAVQTASPKAGSRSDSKIRHRGLRWLHRAVPDAAGTAGPFGHVGHAAACPQTPLLRGVGAEREVAAGGHRVGGPSDATLQVLQEAEQKMGLQEEQPAASDATGDPGIET